MNTSASGMQDVRNWEVERIGYMESSVNTSDNVTREVIAIGHESSRNDNLESLGNDSRGRICRPHIANRTLLTRMLVAQDAGSPDFRFKGVCGHAFLAAPPVTSVGAGRFRGVASPPALHSRTPS